MPEIVTREIWEQQRLSVFSVSLFGLLDIVRKDYPLDSPVYGLGIVNVTKSVKKDKVRIAIVIRKAFDAYFLLILFLVEDSLFHIGQHWYDSCSRLGLGVLGDLEFADLSFTLIVSNAVIDADDAFFHINIFPAERYDFGYPTACT